MRAGALVVTAIERLDREAVGTSSRTSPTDSEHALRVAPVILAAALSLASVSLAREVVTVIGQASVVDGDTIEIHGKRIRLFGIDAVESGQRCHKDGKPWLCGKDSAFALADKIGERPITCSGNEFDRYRRLVARCSLNGEDLGGWMVENGWAVVFRRYSDLNVDRSHGAEETDRPMVGRVSDALGVAGRQSTAS